MKLNALFPEPCTTIKKILQSFRETSKACHANALVWFQTQTIRACRNEHRLTLPHQFFVNAAICLNINDFSGAFDADYDEEAVQGRKIFFESFIQVVEVRGEVAAFHKWRFGVDGF